MAPRDLASDLALDFKCWHFDDTYFKTLNRPNQQEFAEVPIARMFCQILGVTDGLDRCCAACKHCGSSVASRRPR